MGNCNYKVGGSVKNPKICGKSEVGTSGLCAKHGGKIVPLPSRTAIFRTSNDEGLTWQENQTDGQMKTWLEGIVTQAQKSNTPAIVGAMQDGYSQGSNGRTSRTVSSVISGATCYYHASQGADGKAGCLTVFWIEYVPGTITPIAIGAHTGGHSYNISWKCSLWPFGNNHIL